MVGNPPVGRLGFVARPIVLETHDAIDGTA
jgi:hypothetical protein